MLCTLWDIQQIHEKLIEKRKQEIRQTPPSLNASIKAEQSYENVGDSKIALNMGFKISLTMATKYTGISTILFLFQKIKWIV